MRSITYIVNKDTRIRKTHASREIHVIRGSFQRHVLPSRVAFVFALCGLSGALAAVDSAGVQFRLTMGIAPGINEITTSNSTFADGTANNDNNGTDLFSPHVGLTFEPGLMYSIAIDQTWGIAVGSNFFYRSVKGSASYAGPIDIELRNNAYGCDVTGGLYWQLPSWRLEVTPVVGYGRSRTTVDVYSQLGETSDRTASSHYVDLGIRVGAFYTLPNYVLFGLQVGYQEFSTTAAKLTLADGSTEEHKVSGAGLLATLSFVLVF